jgi:hypothetical protein
MRSDDAVSAAAGRGGPFAEWGEARCEHGDFAVGLDEAVMDTTAQQALDVAADASSLAIAWDDGTQTTATVSFTPSSDGACVLLDGMFYGQVAWNVAGELAITSEDGRLDATWPGLLFAAAGEAGGFSQVQFELDTTGALPAVTAENLVTVYGVNGVENLDDYDGFSLSIQLVLADMAGGVMGELRLVGFQFAPCAQEPSEPTDPMMGSSGGGTAGSSGGGTAGAGGGTAGGSTPPGSSGGGTAGCQGADTFDLLVGTITGG